MKKILFYFVTLLCTNTLAQQLPENRLGCMSKSEIQAFKKEILAQRDAVLQTKNVNKAQLRLATPQQILFSWPLHANADYDFGYAPWVISNFVDQNTANDPTGALKNPLYIGDWNCGERTYDKHDAEDISNWPFEWHMYEANSTVVVAAADGEILNKHDGTYDKNCARGGSNPNYVSILHDDGTVSSYLHMKSGYVTSLAKGTRVKQGDYLGIVASSGNSTGPHLHFSIYDINDNLIDPYVGPCNTLNNTTWWQTPRNYWEPQINKVMTHSALPVFGCHDEEAMNGKNLFLGGETAIISTYLQDIQENDEVVGNIFLPSGSLYDAWVFTSPATNTTRWFYQNVTLPLLGGSGTWIVRMTYRNKNYFHFFTVGCNNSEAIAGPEQGSKGYIANTSITTTAQHTTNSQTKVLYQANSEITFSPGFEITGGGHLKARIKPCDFVE